MQFFKRKLSGIDIKKTKVRNFSDFHYFCFIFVKTLIDFVDYNVKTPDAWANLLYW